MLYPDSRLVQCAWLVMGQEGNREQGSIADWQAAMQAEALAGLPCTVILPVECALHTLVEVPRQQRRYLHRTLPFALEAQTAQDIDQLHIVPIGFSKGDYISVVALPHSTMEQLQRWFSDLSQTLTDVLLDTQLLASNNPQALHLSWFDDRVLISVQGRGMACGRAGLMQWVERLITPTQEAMPVRYCLDPEYNDQQSILDAELAQSFTDVDLSDQCRNTLLASLAAKYPPKATAGNLLTGPYEPKTLWTSYKRWLPVSAVAVAAVLVTTLLHSLVTTRQLHQEAQATWSLVGQLYQQATGDNRPFNRFQYRAIIESRLQSAPVATSDDALLVPFLFRLQLANQRVNLPFQELRYTADRREVQLQVTAASTEILETFRQQLETEGLTVSYSASRVDSGFRGNFQIRWVGGGQ